MIHGGVGCERHRAAGSDGLHGGAGAANAADVAAQVVGGEICDWGIVVGVWADVLVLCAFDGVGGEVLEDVWGVC
jgi:hypothetical protein